MQLPAALFENLRELQPIPLPDADVSFMQSFYPPNLCRDYFSILLRETAWQQEKISIRGRQLRQPRLTAWYGDPGKSYCYSGIRLQPHPWTPTLSRIRRDLEQTTGHCFNSILLNLYRDQNDSVSWHSDDEPELGPRPVIASISFGETRRFRLRHRRLQGAVSFDLNDGSLLLMAGDTQHFWQHAIVKERSSRGPRINLTFRRIVEG